MSNVTSSVMPSNSAARTKRFFIRFLEYFALFLACFIALLPIWSSFTTSFKGAEEYATTNAMALPRNWFNFGNYEKWTEEIQKEIDTVKPGSGSASVPSADFFTRELDAALLEGRADIAIHSAKDLPYPLPAGIEVIALTESADKSDSLVTRDGKTLDQLPSQSKIGTSSEQRKAAGTAHAR